MLAEITMLLPGDAVQPEELPSTKTSKILTLGPGLKYTPPSNITATTAGSLLTDLRKNALWIESNGRGHYVPTTGDLVLATVHHSSLEVFHCAISPYASFAILPQLAFENATRKTRPQLHTGSLVYARIAQAHKYLEPELECVHPSTGKADGLGELKEGMVFDSSLGFARRLLMGKSKQATGIAVLEELGEKGARFEVAVGRNGKIWVKGEDVKTTIAVGRALQESDSQGYDLKEQAKLVRRLLKDP